MFEAVQILSEIFSGTPEADDQVILFSRQEAWYVRDNDNIRFPLYREIVSGINTEPGYMYLGRLQGRRCFAALTELPETPVAGVEKNVCRRVLAELPEPASSCVPEEDAESLFVTS